MVIYPLVISYIAIERSTMLLMGKSTISMVIFHSYVTNYQRVHNCYHVVPWFSENKCDQNDTK